MKAAFSAAKVVSWRFEAKNSVKASGSRSSASPRLSTATPAGNACVLESAGAWWPLTKTSRRAPTSSNVSGNAVTSSGAASGSASLRLASAATLVYFQSSSRARQAVLGELFQRLPAQPCEPRHARPRKRARVRGEIGGETVDCLAAHREASAESAFPDSASSQP